MIPNIPARAAWQALQENAEARLVDVRTDMEWARIGVPQTPGLAEPVFISWQTAPTMQHNPDFIADLASAGLAKNQPLYFICRSGARSHAAAQAAQDAGYTYVYNVAEGFEGRPGSPGWHAQGLPSATGE